MADPEHLRILEQGVEVWNKWAAVNPEVDPDLVGADLAGATLKGADFRCADLVGADFTDSDLTNADFSYANLTGANLNGASLGGADFSDALVSHTSFGDNDLSRVVGLDGLNHFGPSTIGIDTVFESRGEIPEMFLRGCGVPEEFITHMRSLTVQPIQFYSCFISHSSKDQMFADRVYADLQNNGVRCWLATQDMKIGDKIRVTIDETIRVHDKLLLVLSKHSVSSQWVAKEVETAMELERDINRTVLFPVRLDDAVMGIKSGWPGDVKRTRNIGDFSKWRTPEAYQKALARLLRDLKAEDKQPDR